MNSETALQRTPLYDLHVELGAKIAPFGGFEMPILYKGIINEHHATRQEATLFDTCHMGEFILSGPGALPTLETLVTCQLDNLADGRCRYGLMCAEDGGTLDDLIVYRLSAEHFMVVVNAGTQNADFEWIAAHAHPGTHLENHSESMGKIDLQGPQSASILNRLIPGAANGLDYFHFQTVIQAGHDGIVSRTGYTGELGYEIYFPADYIAKFWREAMNLGAQPAGLGARDTLRLEAGLPLYGHELRHDRNAANAAMPRAIASDKPFIGAAALRDPTARKQILAGLLLNGRQSARQGDTVIHPDSGTVSGRITSGSFAPTIGSAIAMAIVDLPAASPGTVLQIQTARRVLDARVVPLPFYTGTARK